MSTIERDKLVNELESVISGLSSREIIEQSKCFVFHDHYVYTYNGEIACRQKCSLDIEGAVHADKFLNLLRKLGDTTLDVSVHKKELRIKGKGRRKGGLALESKIELPIDTIRYPKSWSSLPSDFIEAVNLVQDCAGTDESKFYFTCVHLHPDFVEACNNKQVARYRVKTGLQKSMLLRKDSIKHVVSLGMTEFGMTKTWMHFKNPNGLILSCMRYFENYPDLNDLMTVKGIRMSLPKGLDQAADRASLFSDEDVDDKRVMVTLEQDLVTLEGRNTQGWWKESRKVKYNRDPMSFRIVPALLAQIATKYNECVLSRKQRRLKAGVGKKFTYVTVLGAADKQEKEKKHSEKTNDE